MRASCSSWAGCKAVLPSGTVVCGAEDSGAVKAEDAAGHKPSAPMAEAAVEAAAVLRMNSRRFNVMSRFLKGCVRLRPS
ncbi:hypothetical protein D3C73_1292450 [compost metagenome]